MKTTVLLVVISILSHFTSNAQERINTKPRNSIRNVSIGLLFGQKQTAPVKTYFNNIIYARADVDTVVAEKGSKRPMVFRVYPKENTVFVTKEEIFKAFNLPTTKYNLPLFVDLRPIDLSQPVLGVKSSIKSVDVKLSHEDKEVIQIVTWEAYNAQQKIKADTTSGTRIHIY